jgi:16S rRNA (cytosine1402-N4)-methyltransferase
LRIAVNDELGGLARALEAFRVALVPGGRLAVISYHSGEDRLVKQAFRAWSTACTCPPGLPVCICGGKASGTLVTRRAIVASDVESAANPRARSAHFRVFQVNDEG